MPDACMIIGTSNSIRNGGYRPILETTRPETQFTLHGIGATPSILLPYILSQVSIGAASTVIVDTHVNDTSNIGAGFVEESVCDGVFFEALTDLKNRGLNVIMLIMPQTERVDLARQLRARRLAIAEKLGLSVVDGYAILDALRDGYGFDDIALFDNSAHAAWPVSLIVAHRLAQLLAGFESRAVGPASQAYALAPLSGDSVTRTSSLLSKTYVRFKPGDEQELVFEEDVCLVALAYNMVQSSGYLTVAPDGRARRFYPLGFDMDGGNLRDLVHVVMPMRVPLQGRRFRLGFVASIPPGREAEFKTRAATNPTAAGRAEIEAAVIRRGSLQDTTRSWRRLTGVADPREPAREALRPDERILAAIARHDAGFGVGKSIARLLRTASQGDTRVWNQPPAEIALHLSKIARATKDEAVQRLLAGQAAADFPKSPALQRAFREAQRSGAADPA